MSLQVANAVSLLVIIAVSRGLQTTFLDLLLTEKTHDLHKLADQPGARGPRRVGSL